MDVVQQYQGYRTTTSKQFTLYHPAIRSFWYSFDQSWKDERLRQTWSRSTLKLCKHRIIPQVSKCLVQLVKLGWNSWKSWKRTFFRSRTGKAWNSYIYIYIWIALDVRSSNLLCLPTCDDFGEIEKSFVGKINFSGIEVFFFNKIHLWLTKWHDSWFHLYFTT